MIHRCRKGSADCIENLIDEQAPLLEVPVELGPEGDAPPGIDHPVCKSTPAAIRGIPDEANTRCTKTKRRTHDKEDTQEETRELRHLIR